MDNRLACSGEARPQRDDLRAEMRVVAALEQRLAADVEEVGQISGVGRVMRMSVAVTWLKLGVSRADRRCRPRPLR
ncbi:hypothetical protein [Streptomyces sp. HUAS TT7]|uniref:hypothetical protein n=1 Tax=Streptomyces sp. HUAS TT7 TaxID=3447507 RepID=UPI003F65DC09